MFEFVIRFIRRFSLRKFLQNKFLVLVIAVFVLCGVAYGVDKAIDGYPFYDDGSGEENGEDLGVGVKFDEDEVDLVLEDFDGSVEASGAESDESGDGGEGENQVDNGGDGNEEMRTSSGEEGESDEKEGEMVESDEIGASATEGKDTRNKIYVYITGEVIVPGVVILDEGSRISDAINAAGGTTVNANVSKVNLVYVLQDGMKVNIPNNSDLKNNPNFEYITTASGDGRNDVYSSYSVGGTSSGSGSSNWGGSKKQDIVNINTASQTELESLPGIGPSLALKIINYRKENGKFSSIEDIKNVSGIGESKFEALKEFINI